MQHRHKGVSGQTSAERERDREERRGGAYLTERQRWDPRSQALKASAEVRQRASPQTSTCLSPVEIDVNVPDGRGTKRHLDRTGEAGSGCAAFDDHWAKLRSSRARTRDHPHHGRCLTRHEACWLLWALELSSLFGAF